MEAYLEEIDHRRTPELPIGLGCALEMFVEKDEILELIESISQIGHQQFDQNAAATPVEISFETYKKIIDRYQEQPHLLDRHIELMLTKLLHYVRADIPISYRHLALKFLRSLFKVRGPKEVVKRMPHEISDLVPVLEFLESLNPGDGTLWESAYVLILWLSILVINPFHLKLLDGHGGDGKSTVAQRIMKVCMTTVKLNNSKVGEASYTLISKFLTRPDMQEIYMETFMVWACENLKPQDMENSGRRIGAFGSLAALFKHGKREEMLKYADKVLDAVLKSEYTEGDTLIRKLGSKLIHRIGLIYLKTKIAPWRYQRGCRSLLSNLKPTAAQINKASAETFPVSQENYDDVEEYSEQIETIIDTLLSGLKDKDTYPRWSAAKGIGRIVNRLPKSLGDEVVEQILDTFKDRESAGTWHGGCLAIAELARRGLLLPERVPATIAVMKKALIYDEIRGNFSIGGHVRDSACYVLWAFARAFDPVVVQNYVNDIATSLVIAMLFDREINCRRAAAAAFQENVGRLGTFPHGIDIITMADYHTLGIRTNAYTLVSVEVGQFKEYLPAMIDHLVTIKYKHYDPNVRELTAVALANLATLDSELVLNTVMRDILPNATSKDSAVAHGAILAIAEVMIKLNGTGKFTMVGNQQNDIRNIVMKILHQQFRDYPFGQLLLREAVTQYIKACAISKFHVHDDMEILETWHAVLEDHVSFLAATLRRRASETFPIFLEEYYYSIPDRAAELKRFIDIFTINLNAPVQTTRLGYALLIGHFPPYLLKSSFRDVISKLIRTATPGPGNMDWADVRRDAIYSIAKLLSVGIVQEEKDPEWKQGIPISELNIDGLMECFMKGLEDYTTDKRGDIGSWVREACMTALKDLVLKLHKSDIPSVAKTHLHPNRITQIFSALSKQCVEKIDNIRVHAAKLFVILLHFNDPPLEFPSCEKLREIFSKKFCQNVNWRSPAEAYPKFVQLLEDENFTYSILSGLVLSGANLTRDSSTSIGGYLMNSPPEETGRIAKVLVQVFKDNLKVDRVTIPLMHYLTALLQSGLFLPIVGEGNDGFAWDLLEVLRLEMKSSKVDRLMAGIEVMCELLQGSPGVIHVCLRRLVIYLLHNYPRIRYHTASKLYEALLTYNADTFEEKIPNFQGALDILSNTEWIQQDKESIRPIRDEFCNLMEVAVPVMLTKPKTFDFTGSTPTPDPSS